MHMVGSRTQATEVEIHELNSEGSGYQERRKMFKGKSLAILTFILVRILRTLGNPSLG